MNTKWSLDSWRSLPIRQVPGYADQVSVPDRWAIVAYIRALQLSQNAPISDVPPDALSQLEAQP